MAFCTCRRPKTSLLLLVARWKDVTNLGLEKSQPSKCFKKKDTPRIPLETPTSSSVSAVSSNSFFKNRAKPGPGRRSLGSLLGLRRQWISYHVTLFFCVICWNHHSCLLRFLPMLYHDRMTQPADFFRHLPHSRKASMWSWPLRPAPHHQFCALILSHTWPYLCGIMWEPKTWRDSIKRGCWGVVCEWSGGISALYVNSPRPTGKSAKVNLMLLKSTRKRQLSRIQRARFQGMKKISSPDIEYSQKTLGLSEKLLAPKKNIENNVWSDFPRFPMFSHSNCHDY